MPIYTIDVLNSYEEESISYIKYFSTQEEKDIFINSQKTNEHNEVLCYKALTLYDLLLNENIPYESVYQNRVSPPDAVYDTNHLINYFLAVLKNIGEEILIQEFPDYDGLSEIMYNRIIKDTEKELENTYKN